VKKIVVVFLLAASGYVAHGYSVFPSDKISRYLDVLEDEINRGSTADACEQLADDVRYTFADTTTRQPIAMSGGKDALCKHFADIASFYAKAAVADNHSMADISTRLDWLHPNRAKVRYDDHHEITFYPERTVMRAVAHQTLTLAKFGNSYQILAWDVKAEPEPQ
jgi:hypothetical protein